MKRFLKVLMIAFVLVPCMAILTACGGNAFTEPTVDTKGTYSNSTAEAYNTFVADEDAKATFDESTGYKMSIDIETEAMEVAGQTIPGQKQNIVAIVTLTEEHEIAAMAFKMNMDMGTVKSTIEAYVPNDGYMYVNGSGEVEGQHETVKGKTPMSFEDAMNGYDINFDMNIVNALLEAEGVVVKVAESGATTKYEISLEGAVEQFEDVKINLVFENKVLTGMVFAGTMDMYGMEASYKVVMTSFDGEIKMPNFDSYEEIDF